MHHHIQPNFSVCFSFFGHTVVLNSGSCACLAVDHTPSHFGFTYFSSRVSCFCLGLASDSDPPTYSMNHHIWPKFSLFNLGLWIMWNKPIVLRRCEILCFSYKKRWEHGRRLWILWPLWLSFSTKLRKKHAILVLYWLWEVSTRVWTQYLTLARQALYHLSHSISHWYIIFNKILLC
jgi:hypothetical protein